MFSLPVMLVVTAIFTAIHVAVWHILPRKMRHIAFANPLLAFIMDFFGSGIITVFTGVASFVGICNLAASVIFGLYAIVFITVVGIKGIQISWHKVWIIPIFPKLMVVYSRGGKTWVE
jgi:hypothetical protein